MARIRSIHPGLFTDEVFMSLSMPARVLLMGLWTEADDHGVFEWKPITLKARLLPADNLSVPELLEELRSNQVVQRVEDDGSAYGLVRNFCKFQRPKHPTYKHPFPPAWGNFVAWKGTATPELPPEGVKTSADGEEGREEKEDPPSPPQAGGPDASQGDGKPEAPSRANGTNPRSIAKAKREAEEAAALTQARLKREAEDDAKWLPRIGEFQQTGKWPSAWGAQPNPNPAISEAGVFLPKRLWPALAEARAQRSLVTDLPDNLRRAPDDAAQLAARYEELKNRRTA